MNILNASTINRCISPIYNKINVLTVYIYIYKKFTDLIFYFFFPNRRSPWLKKGLRPPSVTTLVFAQLCGQCLKHVGNVNMFFKQLLKECVSFTFLDNKAH